MCGVIGFISNSGNAIPNVMNGLKTLEYRGYDSAGVAYLYNGVFQNVKSEGEVSKLFQKLPKDIKSELAIGHTRWATTGIPNETNAHPHRVKDIILVHNGIIENYKELSVGLKPKSQTDSEIVAHLIAKETGTLLDRVQKTVKKIKGSYALAVISEKETDKIVLACKFSPLMIGVCQKGAAIASDIYALIGHTSEAIALSDGETAEIGNGYFKIFDADDKEITSTKVALNVIQDLQILNEHDHDTFMHKEIFEQPRVLLQTLLHFESIPNLPEILQSIQNSKIMLTACGTSFHACLIAQMFFEELGIDCDVKLASELRYSNRKLIDKSVLIAVSQSGETADTIAVMRMAKEKGAKLISVINRLGSAMDRLSDHSVYICAGPEISVASTKSFTAQLMALCLLGGYMKGDNHIIEKLKEVPAALGKIINIDTEQHIRNVAKEIAHVPSMFFLGRGYGVPVAMEGALKVKEISYIHAEAYPAGELKHGSIALVSKGMPCVFIADMNSGTYEKIMSNIQEVKARGAVIVAVASEKDKKINSVADYVINIPLIDKVLMPLTASAALQLLAYHIADIKGCNIDKPKNLAKAVSVE